MASNGMTLANISKAANAAHAVQSGNPMAAVASYVTPGTLGMGDLGQYGNMAFNAGKTMLTGGSPVGAAMNAVGSMLPDEYKQYMPMAKALMSASEGKMSLNSALAAIKSLNQ
jgi:hypothetical protein